MMKFIVELFAVAIISAALAIWRTYKMLQKISKLDRDSCEYVLRNWLVDIIAIAAGYFMETAFTLYVMLEG